MASSTKGKWMQRLNGILGLLIGIFGALAIIGVFFKIAKYPNYELYMQIGFIGEAAAFVIMGVFALINGFTSSGEGASGSAAVSTVDPDAAMREAGAAAAASMEQASREFQQSMSAAAEDFRAQLGHMLTQHVSKDLGVTLQSVSTDVEQFGGEVRRLGDELREAREAVASMRETLDRTATGELPADAKRLGDGMRSLAEGMTGASEAVYAMQSNLSNMALRFRAFNEPDGARARANGQREVGHSVVSS